MTFQMDEASSLIIGNSPYGMNLTFDFGGVPLLEDGGEYPRVTVRLHNENYRNLIAGCTQHLRYQYVWNGLGGAIAYNTSLRRINLQAVINNYNRRNEESDGCMEAILRGIHWNRSIEQLEIDMKLIADDEATLPGLNLHDVQFKSSLKVLELLSGTISESQSFMISSFIENISLEEFFLAGVDVGDHGEEISESALTRVILACTKVKRLKIYCETASQYASLASSLENPTSILSEMNFCGEFDNAEGVSIIASGLARNKTLQILSSWAFEGELRPIAKALCDASSIEGIHASNHTLQNMFHKRGDTETIPTLPEMITTCLELNKNANKDEVIRAKIARFYFIGNFDISPFSNMSLSVVPEVLNLITGDDIYQQSAIFRMLKTIPELCNVSSRDVGHAEVNEGSCSPSNKRQKIENQ